MFSVNNLTSNPTVAITSHIHHRGGNTTTRTTAAAKTSNNGILRDRTKDVKERTQAIVTVIQLTTVRPRAMRLTTHRELILCVHKIICFLHQKKAYHQFFHHMQCLKLEKSLYGLRVSSRNWYDVFAAKLRSINFQPLYTYETVFTRRLPTGIVILLLYVDDCKLTGSREELIRQAFEDIRASGINLEFLDDAHNFLGIHYERTGKHTMTASRFPSPDDTQYANLSNSNNVSYQYYLSEEILRTSASHYSQSVPLSVTSCSRHCQSAQP